MEYFINFFPVKTRHLNRFQKRGLLLNALFLLVLVVLSYILIKYDLDRKISRLFYSPDTGWKFAGKEPWRLMHRYGHIPGVVFSLLSFLLYAAAPFKTGLARYGRYFLVIILTAGIGGGVVVNLILKNNWGRPRPVQVKEFGGQWEYRDVNSPGITGKGHSFSCGHCTMGYIFLTTVFFYEKSKIFAVAGGITGILLGVLMSLARVGQGGHFASDTLWSLGIILITANTLYNILLFPPEQETRDEENERKRVRRVALIGFTVLGAAALSGLFLSPVYYERKLPLHLTSETEELNLKINFQNYNLNLLESGDSGASIFASMTARGSPSVTINDRVRQINRGKNLCVEYSPETDKKLVSAKLAITVSLPVNIKFHEVTTGGCGQERT